ncbi:MAG: COX aromatic rich motif-containing protein [Pseudomonadota bacterium]|nr:COX aromatic rich motif-containing protein [Pseudomonadota bacterium]
MRVKKVTTALLLFLFITAAHATGFLTPRGTISQQQHKLFFDTIALMLIVVLPVIVMSLAFGFEFSKKNRRWPHTPEWSHNTLLECFWWGIPAIIILILSIITWQQTHELDPYKEIVPGGEKEVIEAVALRWKWLFIYPKENIASINEVYFPVGQQVEFHITADAPMSAFSIPQLGGQIYAMAGMRTRQFLYTENEGIYDGLNTQLNGDGFSDMHFKAHVVSKQKFQSWVSNVKLTASPLGLETYKELYKPTIAAPVEHYAGIPEDFFMKIIMQYMEKDSWLH